MRISLLIFFLLALFLAPAGAVDCNGIQDMDRVGVDIEEKAVMKMVYERTADGSMVGKWIVETGQPPPPRKMPLPKEVRKTDIRMYRRHMPTMKDILAIHRDPNELFFILSTGKNGLCSIRRGSAISRFKNILANYDNCVGNHNHDGVFTKDDDDGNVMKLQKEPVRLTVHNPEEKMKLELWGDEALEVMRFIAGRPDPSTEAP